MMYRDKDTQMMLSNTLEVRAWKQRSQSGFTLVEAMIVIAIISIFATVITLNFTQANNKYIIESYTKDIHALLMRARNDASTSNIQRIVTLAANQIQITTDLNNNDAFDAGEPRSTYAFPRFGLVFAANNIIFDRRGLTNNIQTLQINHPRDAAPGADCIVIAVARINIGRMTGGNCDPQ